MDDRIVEMQLDNSPKGERDDSASEESLEVERGGSALEESSDNSPNFQRDGSATEQCKGIDKRRIRKGTTSRPAYTIPGPPATVPRAGGGGKIVCIDKRGCSRSRESGLERVRIVLII
jgi:hypothetical protein